MQFYFFIMINFSHYVQYIFALSYTFFHHFSTESCQTYHIIQLLSESILYCWVHSSLGSTCQVLSLQSCHPWSLDRHVDCFLLLLATFEWWTYWFDSHQLLTIVRLHSNGVRECATKLKYSIACNVSIQFLGIEFLSYLFIACQAL